MHQGVVTSRSPRPAGRKRSAGFVFGLLGTLAVAGLSVPASAPAQSYGSGYAAAARGNGLVWFGAGQNQAANRLLALLATSEVDGINPKQFNIRAMQRAIRAASKGRAQAQSADRLLTTNFLRYVAAVRSVAPSKEWSIIDREVISSSGQAAALLRNAAAKGEVGAFVDGMPWMHETYAGLRTALLDADRRGDRATAARIRLNLDRARMLPGAGGGRYVMVNAAAQRLYMYENGKVVGWMRVVVGKASQPTPMMAALIRYTAVNPYWNLPSDLVAERIAPNVLKQGLPYLKAKGYVVLSDWSNNPARVDPATIDWNAVVSGRTAIRLRQNPGPANAMGRMKFMFPNQAGIYLHDTPNKELLDEPARLLSAGCVRLEDAPRLARWLYGRPLTVTRGMKPEQKVDLAKPVPVYIAYLTAVPSGGQTVFYDDIYGRDRARLRNQRIASR